jgi:hypothetical protein
MGRIVNAPSTCAGIALWAIGCSAPAPKDSKTVLVIVVTEDAGAGDAVNPMSMPDAAALGSPDGSADASDSTVDPDATDAGVCNQPGPAACDAAIGAMCQRIAQCCSSLSSCEAWATDLGRCKAHFAEGGFNCASPEFAGKTVCASLTDQCQGDVPLVACTDLGIGTANWPASCNTLWKQFEGPADSGPTTCVPSNPPSEICNDKDDDCNGIVDDGCPRGPVWALGNARPALGDSTGGNPFADTCAADEVLVGLRVAAGPFITQVRGVCRKYVVKPTALGDLAGAGITMGAMRELAPHPATTTDPVQNLICPDAKILVGIRLSQQNVVFAGNKSIVSPRIWGTCADPAFKSTTARFEWQTTTEIGPISGSYANIMDWIVSDRVASPSVLVGVHGFSGAWIDRVGTISSGYAMTFCSGVVATGPDPMNRVNWTATASASSSYPGDAITNAFDASPTTRWTSGKPQSGNEWFKLDLGAVGCVGRLSLASTSGDFPVRYSLAVSADDKTYVPAASGTGQTSMTIDFPSRDVRYIRINQMGTSASWWSITDIAVDK